MPAALLRLNARTFPMTPEERSLLESAGAQIIEIEGNRDEEIAAAGAQADAVMVVSACLRGPVIARLEKCRIISRLGTGVDKIDISEATRQGILVTNLPDFCTEEVADHTMALLLASARQLKRCESAMREGRQPRSLTEMHRLSTRTLGLIGYGRIGRAVAVRAQAFGMKVLASDPALSHMDSFRARVRKVDMDTVLAESDYVVLLCPLLPETRRMIAMPRLRKMKPGAALINTARGELIDEDDLAAALQEGAIRYAALDVYAGIDVFNENGFATDHPFFSLENVLMTPHVAAYSEESFADSHRHGAQAVVDVLSGRWPRHPVNPEAVPRFPLERVRG
ncbi:MAG: C-terminal binding protein [Armatimonadetes bacterium]|nr:C-terminal binding protein [Armatimonadota bacterium]